MTHKDLMEQVARVSRVSVIRNRYLRDMEDADVPEQRSFEAFARATLAYREECAKLAVIHVKLKAAP